MMENVDPSGGSNAIEAAAPPQNPENKSDTEHLDDDVDKIFAFINEKGEDASKAILMKVFLRVLRTNPGFMDAVTEHHRLDEALAAAEEEKARLIAENQIAEERNEALEEHCKELASESLRRLAQLVAAAEKEARKKKATIFDN